MDISLQAQGLYNGLYIKDGVEYKTYVTIDRTQGRIIIHKENAWVPGENVIHGDNEYTYFSGNFELKDEKIYFTLNKHFKELTGYDKIIFEPCEDESILEYFATKNLGEYSRN